MNIIIANINKVHHIVENFCMQEFNAEIAHSSQELREKMKGKEIDFIFFLHWSELISKEIYDNYRCIVFHMTDLPFGRGGSPLQNLIIRGYTETKISAIRVCKELDAGDIYLKKELSLHGTAEEIFIRTGKIMLEMIREIMCSDIIPSPQEGYPILFKRRKPEDGNIVNLDSIEQIYDYIRMLDAEGYPNAFLINGAMKFEFSRASLKADGVILADVKISKIK